MEFHHRSVLLEECVRGLGVHPDGIYVDGTAGGAGHSLEIAKRLNPDGRLVAVDKDEAALDTARRRLAAYPQAVVVQGDFRELRRLLEPLGIDGVDGILLDLGVSSHQLDTPERGFSYHADAPLDMRMSGSGKSARDVVNTYEAQRLERVLWDYGEERYTRQIVRAIVRRREQRPIETTGELAELIKSAVPPAARREGGHPAKRVFQAVRIEVNGELDSLEQCLEEGFSLLNQGGRFAVITFHSLEDRMVKRAFAGYIRGCVCPPEFPICVCGRTPGGRLVNKKPVTPSEEELKENRRSRSAKLRILEKII